MDLPARRRSSRHGAGPCQRGIAMQPERRIVDPAHAQGRTRRSRAHHGRVHQTLTVQVRRAEARILATRLVT